MDIRRRELLRLTTASVFAAGWVQRSSAQDPVRCKIVWSDRGASTALANIDPEPSSFGSLPARGLLVRHAKDVEFRDVEITSIQADQRPFIWLSDVDDATFSLLNLSPRPDLPASRLHATSNLTVSMSPGLPNASIGRVTDGWFP